MDLSHGRSESVDRGRWRVQITGICEDEAEEMQTVSEAAERVEELFVQQVAAGEGADPNTSVDGDAAARRLFAGALPPPTQRRLFLKFCRNPKFWPRIRTLVGPPPFTFLRAEDEGAVRAGGISRGRVRLSNPEGAPAFVPHFTDEEDRSFQALIARDEREKLAFVALADGAETVLAVKLKGRSRKGKLGFPRPGSTVRLLPNSFTRESVKSVHVVVLRLQHSGGHTARMLVRAGQ